MDSCTHSTLTAVGLMSGTSVDGIDAALLRVRGSGRAAKLEFLGFRCFEFPRQVRDAVLALASDSPTTPGDISRMGCRLGQLYANAVLELAKDLQFPVEQIDCIGCHGQTIFHQGQPEDYAGAEVACTLQIGEPAVIAAATGLPVVNNFRAADRAAGGQGAPLVPYFDFVFLRSDTTSRAVQNIGGIANVTWLPAGCDIDDVIAFDSGPGNMLIDTAARHFIGGELDCDLDGAMALAGRPAAALLERLLEHPFYAMPPPKSAGREQFGAHYLQQVLQWTQARGLTPNDILATLTELTARTIADSLRDLPGRIDELIVSGGGVENPALTAALERASGLEVKRLDGFGVPGEAREAAAFALLAAETLRGVPSNVPSATGASRPMVLGSITPAQGAPAQIP